MRKIVAVAVIEGTCLMNIPSKLSEEMQTDKEKALEGTCVEN